jgi:LuxR family transcriptional regulator, regulator of acetate metabolism
MRGLLARAETTISTLREGRRQAVLDHSFTGPGARQRLDDLLADAKAALVGFPDSLPLLQVLADITVERRRMHEHDAAERERADIAVAEALERLRGLNSSGAMSRRAPAELREACGFTRVMISTARGSRWMPDTMRPSDHGDPAAAEFARFAQTDNEIPLAHLLPETEMVRHRVPVIVSEGSMHAYKPLVQVTKTTSYVAAPIVTTRRVIGFFHADRIGQSGNVTRSDRDSIALFAAEFAVLFEHAVLTERVQQRRSRWTAGLLAIIDELDRPTATVPFPTSLDDVGNVMAKSRQDAQPGKQSRTLTERERQVMRLVASGATNHDIAGELVLSLDTVKTHVKNIMRKLHATSRAGAAAKYLQSLNRLGLV